VREHTRETVNNRGLDEVLGLKSGRWPVSNFGRIPSEKNCKLVMMALEDQGEELLNTGIVHAVRDHGHEDTPELRRQLDKGLEELALWVYFLK